MKRYGLVWALGLAVLLSGCANCDDPFCDVSWDDGFGYERKDVPLYDDPIRLRIDCRFISYEKPVINQLIREKGEASVEDLEKLFTQGKGELRYAPSLMTLLEVDAEVKAVAESIYPTEFNIVGVTNVQGVTGGIVEPSAFETREVGYILQAFVERSPDGKTFFMDASPEIVELDRWEEYAIIVQKGKEVPARQPIFESARFTTRLAVKDGETVLAGGGMTMDEGDTVVYCLLTLHHWDGKNEPPEPEVETLAEPASPEELPTD